MLTRSRQQAAELKSINDYQRAGNTLTDKQSEARRADEADQEPGGLIPQSMKDEKAAVAAAEDATKKIVTPVGRQEHRC